jgi:hypothetical protein
MKKVIMASLFALVATVSFGQEENEIVPDLKPYEDASSRLFISKVIELPGKSQKELVNQFKNWASTSFVNLREVMVSETENQIVLNYTTQTASYMKSLGMKIPHTMSWYVRLVAQFKDGKARIQFYDDGNAFKPGEYSRYGNIPSISARSLYVSYVTNKPESFKDMHKPANVNYDLHYQWQNNVSSIASACEKGMKEETSLAKSDF